MNSLGEKDKAKQIFRAASNGRENSGPPVLTVKSDISQLPNLDLSLLPSRESMGSFSNQYSGQPSASPQQYCPVLHSPKLNVFGSPTPTAEQPPCSHLTIFYAGKVNVYNVSSNKANEIMAMANRIIDSPTSGSPSSSTSTPPKSTPRCMDVTPSTPCPSPAGILSGTQSTQTIKDVTIPFSRTFSIRNFLERRNDRIRRKVPYSRPAEK